MIVQSLVPPRPFYCIFIFYNNYNPAMTEESKKQIHTATSFCYRKDRWAMKENSYGLNTLSTKASHKRSKLSPRGKLWLVCQQQQVQTGWCRPRTSILMQAPPIPPGSWAPQLTPNHSGSLEHTRILYPTFSSWDALPLLLPLWMKRIIWVSLYNSPCK